MDAGLEQNIKDNIEKVRTRIFNAAKRSGRESGEISLVAVTKQKSAAVVKTLAENGVKRIGESYLQEAVFKIDLLANQAIEWHMIGNIQRGKEKQIANHFDVVHSVGTLKTARELNRHAAQIDRVLPVYLEINVSGESTKHGWLIMEKGDLKAFQCEIEPMADLANLRMVGLMTMAPYSVDPEDSRPYFKHMREIRDYLTKHFNKNDLIALSMGMSGDFEVAIEEGATIVRIGSALVGPR